MNLGALEARIRRHYESLGAEDAGPSWHLQAIAAPVFHGHTFSIAIELERPADIPVIEDALSGEHVDLVLEDTDSPSNLAATGQNDVLVRLRTELDGRNSTRRLPGCGCGLLRTICACMHRMRWSARWICDGSGRRGRCSKALAIAFFMASKQDQETELQSCRTGLK